MIRLKRFFLIKKEHDFGNGKPQTPASVKDFVNNEVDFLSSIDHDDMENIVKGNVEPCEEYNQLGYLCYQNEQYKEQLLKLDDARILASEKNFLLDFSSQIVMEEISVKSIEKMNKISSKTPKIEPVTIMTEESKEDENGEESHDFPTLSTSKNILGVRCSERISKLIGHYMSKFSGSENPENNIVSIVHYCLAQNKMTYDGYYIVKNIINSILTKCPEILSFFKLLDLDINKDIFFNDSETIKRDYSQIFITFVKSLRELKLDYNIVVVVSQADVGYIRDNLQNFIYGIRQATKYFPPYLKFIFTLTEDSIIENDEISRILMLNSIPEEGDVNEINIISKDLFENYGDHALDLIDIPSSLERNVVKEKGENDFERILDLSELLALKIPSQDIIEKYDFKLAAYLMFQMEACGEVEAINILLRILGCTKIPIEIGLLAKICGLEEGKLNQIINEQLNAFIWNFKKSVLAKPAKTEEDKGDDLISNNGHETGTFVCISSPNLGSFDNAVDVHNDIVRVLRGEPLEHYSKNGLLYHISEGDEDYTNDYLEEDSKIEPENLKENGNSETEMEEKKKDVTFFDLYEILFKSSAIYELIQYHQGFDFLINEIGYILSSNQTDIIEKERSQLLNFRNILYLIQQTIKNEELGYTDFGSQLRGRLIGEEEKSLMYKLRIDITNQRHTYFKGFQNSLRENAKIETVIKFAFSVNKTCLFSDQRRLAVFNDVGLIFIGGIDYEIISIISNPYHQTDCCQYYSQQVTIEEEGIEDEVEEEFLFTAGNDPCIRKWDLNTQREVAHYQCHKTNGTIMILFNEYLFTTGSDKRLVRFNIEKEKIEQVYKCKDQITSVRILENPEDKEGSKVLISTLGGYLELLDLDLGIISSLSLSNSNEFIVSLINHSQSEFLSFSKDGEITVYDQETLSIIKEESILNLKSDDYLDMILIRSKEYVLFTLEKQKMDFFTGATFKKTDSWDYFFDEDLHHCDQNYEGSKIIVSDKGGYVTLFNFLKNADPNSKGMQLSGNRRNDPVACIEVTNGLDQDKIISCSTDRDLRIWKKEDGVFSKKYDLGSFTNESITSMKLGKDQNMLFIGSKDMNVYQIDIGRGKLGVVYEGHWNKVNVIHTIPERDILITVSESNIKVWDLEYDECIKNMNDHESCIVHVSQYEEKSQQHILTIGSNFEMRMWNYETGEDSKEHELNVNKSGKLKNVVGACTYRQKLFLATNKNILIYGLVNNEVLHEFKPYNGEQVIDIFGYQTKDNEYLIITTRTSCILYDLCINELGTRITKIGGYHLNAKHNTQSNYKSNFRFFFTSGKISPLKAISKTEVKKLIAGNTFTGLLENTEGVSFENTNQVEPEATELMSKEKNVEKNTENTLTTRVIDTAREKVRQEVLLVGLGDSKGYLHFNHLYL